jgi:hypothetical protein
MKELDLSRVLCDDAASNRGENAMAWIIVNVNDPELCWSNMFGWVSEDYDTFDEDERQTLRLPVEGEWEQVPWNAARD